MTRVDITADPVTAYGYMNRDRLSDRAASAVESDLRTWSRTHRFGLFAIFVEARAGSQAEFEELLTELVRTQTRSVVVPSFEHFAVHPILQVSMLERLERRTGATSSR